MGFAAGKRDSHRLLLATGCPTRQPYFVPFGRPDAQSGCWKNPKYSGGTLQRARTTDNFKDALQHPTRDTWAFTPNYVDVLTELLPKTEVVQSVVRIKHATAPILCQR